MRRGSEKPCPGCGLTNYYRKASEVCARCKQLLKKAEWMEKELSKMGEEEVIVAMGQMPYWNQYLHSNSGTGKHLVNIMVDLVLAVSRPSMEYSSEFNILGKIDSGGAKYVVMNRVAAEKIKLLREEIEKAIKAEYKKGKEDGSNLLMNLASGDVTVKEFNKEVLRK